MNVFSIILFCLISFVTVFIHVDGLRGGFRSGGFRSGGIRTGTRISSGVRNSVRVNSYNTRVRVRQGYGYGYRPWGHTYGGWNIYGGHGHIYGYYWYTRTRHYHDHPDREPTICRNEFDNTMDNGTHYEWFICPSEKDPSSFNYCCGEEDRQYCCRYWDNGWRVFGSVFSILLFFGFVFLVIYCCCCRKPAGSQKPYFQNRLSSKRRSTSELNITTNIPLMPQDPHYSGSGFHAEMGPYGSGVYPPQQPIQPFPNVGPPQPYPYAPSAPPYQPGPANYPVGGENYPSGYMQMPMPQPTGVGAPYPAYGGPGSTAPYPTGYQNNPPPPYPAPT